MLKAKCGFQRGQVYVTMAHGDVKAGREMGLNLLLYEGGRPEGRHDGRDDLAPNLGNFLIKGSGGERSDP